MVVPHATQEQETNLTDLMPQDFLVSAASGIHGRRVGEPTSRPRRSLVVMCLSGFVDLQQLQLFCASLHGMPLMAKMKAHA